MGLAKRLVKRDGSITLIGRRYLIPEYCRQEVVGREVFADDDGVIKQDLPKLGLHAVSSVRIWFPNRYHYFTTASLIE